jgi:hypothetical protein
MQASESDFNLLHSYAIQGIRECYPKHLLFMRLPYAQNANGRSECVPVWHNNRTRCLGEEWVYHAQAFVNHEWSELASCFKTLIIPPFYVKRGQMNIQICTAFGYRGTWSHFMERFLDVEDLILDQPSWDWRDGKGISLITKEGFQNSDHKLRKLSIYGGRVCGDSAGIYIPTGLQELEIVSLGGDTNNRLKFHGGRCRSLVFRSMQITPEQLQAIPGKRRESLYLDSCNYKYGTTEGLIEFCQTHGTNQLWFRNFEQHCPNGRAILNDLLEPSVRDEFPCSMEIFHCNSQEGGGWRKWEP